MNAVYTIGRIFLSLVFVVSGVQKLMDIAGTAKYLEGLNVPIPDQVTTYLAQYSTIPKYEALAYLVSGVEVLGALMVLVGLKARWGAALLIIFTALTVVVAHHFWDMTGEAFQTNLVQALKNLSVIGGLLLVVAVGSGTTAVDRR
ncbi:DoxX family protein [Rhodoplanes sp. Z2-YC6860]|uniref:DoxX family protein n=1 Tax=Rhodoplanes sp. Z2-YC6860 TaxID=674703 RepID=UPI00078E2F84|nr:DoxX family protein [Rhodoplanes sp. Z2-YC6860]AMN42856.1 DoxX family protein [Rhodoplanes sp. Z2-YC6860]